MSSFESNAVASPSSAEDSVYSRSDINKAVALGQALGAIWQYCEYANASFTLMWELGGKAWTIIATYDSITSRRDVEAEDTFYYHASINAPYAKAFIRDAEGHRLVRLDD
jgi:hypothetical protein